MDSRFWENVKKGEPWECWEWQGGIDRGGYGLFTIRGDTLGRDRRTTTAHRFAYEVSSPSRERVPEDLHVCHICDNKRCCNPMHLFVGTRSDNIQDASAKGRMPRKLSDEEVRQIRKLYAAGQLTQREIGETFGCSQGSIFDITSGRTYKWLT